MLRCSLHRTALFALGLFACTAETSGQSAADKPLDPAGESEPTTPSDDPNAPSRSDDPSAFGRFVAQGLSITSIAVFQGVKVELMKSGAWVKKRNSPVVAGRPALLRVYVALNESSTGKTVTAELRLADGTAAPRILRDTKVVSGASSDERPGSTFDFEVPADSMTTGTVFQVALKGSERVAQGDESPARFPVDGSERRLEALAGGKLNVVIVPVKYDADGSGRLPDVSAAQLERYRQTFLARYPTADVEVTARAPFAWSGPIGRNGAGFSNVLRAVTQLRQQDGAAPDVYYYGAFTPSASFAQFCTSGCVAGLSAVVEDAKTSMLRASVGLGYAGAEAASTAAHEVGHAHGREHAPCGGTQGVDASFPYTNGGIGVWGYNILTKTFVSPSKGTDMMGYCPNEWVSDYTFAALFDRVSAVSPVKLGESTAPSSGEARAEAAQRARGVDRRTYRLATVEPDGSLGASDVLQLDEEPSGGSVHEASYAAAAGQPLASATARFYRFDHLPGGFLLLPEEVAGRTWSHARIRGFKGSLTH